jgi:hypothetical protein
LKPNFSFRQRWTSWHTYLARRMGWRYLSPPLGQIDFGDLRRVEPLEWEPARSDDQLVERYYVEQFFRREAPNVKGHVLHIGHEHYTPATESHLKMITALPFTDDAELLKYLAITEDNKYDTLILERVLHLVYDIDTVMHHAHRVLTAGGVLLATVPGTCYAARRAIEPLSYWRLTRVSLQKIVEEKFPSRRTKIEMWGNVIVAMAHLHRVEIQQLTQQELDYRDEHYPLILTLTAEKGVGLH